MLCSTLIRSGSRAIRPGQPGFSVQSRLARVSGATIVQRSFSDSNRLATAKIPDVKSHDSSPSASAQIPKPPTASAGPATASKTSPSTPTTASTLPPTGTGTASTGPTTSSSPSSIPPVPKKKARRLRSYFFYLVLLSALGYGGGVYYALRSDNWHDFFTEYVPGGEDVVGYFEEREFRKRFPGRSDDESNPRLYKQVSGEKKVNIPSKSGVSWKVTQDEAKKTSDAPTKGKHVSAAQKETTQASSSKAGLTPKVVSKETEKGSPVERKLDSKTAEAPQSAAPKSSESPENSEPPKPKPQPTISQVDKLAVPAAEDPTVQHVVKIVNDLIMVINADGAASKYSSSIAKAKEEVERIASDLATSRESLQKAAEDKLQSVHSEFDEAAKELLRRVQNDYGEQENRWREDFEKERERLAKSWKEKLKNQLLETEKAYNQHLTNELLSQSIQLQKRFGKSVRDKIEAEREGRLGRLQELQDSVDELEKLTAEWNSVVDANLDTQHLHVALDAVRARLEQADRPLPFVSELAALKEISGDDPIVSAAIASITPTSYQRGVPTSSQLVDRFRAVAAEVRKAALLPAEAGMASHLASLALSKVMFEKKGMPDGSDVESVLARTEGYLEEGRLEDAAREANSLEGWAKVLAGDWLSDVRRVCEVRQALDVIGTEARLRGLLAEKKD